MGHTQAGSEVRRETLISSDLTASEVMTSNLLTNDFRGEVLIHPTPKVVDVHLSPKRTKSNEIVPATDAQKRGEILQQVHGV